MICRRLVSLDAEVSNKNREKLSSSSRNRAQGWKSNVRQFSDCTWSVIRFKANVEHLSSHTISLFGCLVQQCKTVTQTLDSRLFESATRLSFYKLNMASKRSDDQLITIRHAEMVDILA